MTNRPSTIEEYIDEAPAAGRSHLQHIYRILKDVAPEADAIIKWNAPFFVEPRYLFSFSGHKAHCNFAPSEEALEAFADELENFKTTKNYLQIPYTDPVPEDLIRRIAEYQLMRVKARDDDSFW